MPEKISPEAPNQQPLIFPEILIDDMDTSTPSAVDGNNNTLGDDESLYLYQAMSALKQGELPDGIKRDFNIGIDEQIGTLTKRASELLESYESARAERRNASLERQNEIREKREKLLDNKLNEELNRVGKQAATKALDDAMIGSAQKIEGIIGSYNPGVPGSAGLMRYFAKQDVDADARNNARNARYNAMEARRKKIDEHGGSATIDTLKAKEEADKKRKEFKERIGVRPLKNERVDELPEHPEDTSGDSDDPEIPDTIYNTEQIEELIKDVDFFLDKFTKATGKEKIEIEKHLRNSGMSLYESLITNSLYEMKALSDEKEQDKKREEVNEYISNFLEFAGMKEGSEERQAFIDKLHEIMSNKDFELEETEKIFEEFENIHKECIEQREQDNSSMAPDTNGVIGPGPRQNLNSRWQKLRDKFSKTPENSKDKKKSSFLSKAIGATVLAGTLLAVGVGLSKLNFNDDVPMERSTRKSQSLYGGPGSIEEKNRTERSDDTSSTTTVASEESREENSKTEKIKEIKEINAAIKAKGISAEIPIDENTNIDELIKNFHNMVNNPEDFERMMQWFDRRVEQLMRDNPKMSNSEAEKVAKNEGLRYFKALEGRANNSSQV